MITLLILRYNNDTRMLLSTILFWDYTYSFVLEKSSNTYQDFLVVV